MSISMYDEVYETLVPYGSYLQMPKSVIVEGKVKGFPVETVVAFAAGVVIASFFKGFFSELGKIAAQKTLDKIMAFAKSKKEFGPKEINEINTLIMSEKSEMGVFSSEKVKKANLEGKRMIENELITTGIPSYRIDKLSHKCSIILRSKIIENDNEIKKSDV